jgi:membrane-bound ClpP family serine protease
MDILKAFGPLLGQVAPTIATALGGPLAGIAVKTLSNALLGREDGSAEDVSSALATASPEQLAQIKQIDADFRVRMKELDIDLERISVSDRESARNMQTQTQDWIPRVLAILITVGFFGILAYMLLNGMPKSGTEALLMMLGALGTAWTGVINFYYGSSAGSKAKTDAMANMKGDK